MRLWGTKSVAGECVPNLCSRLPDPLCALLGPCGPAWAIVGRALVGLPWDLVGAHGPMWAKPLWAPLGYCEPPWALVGRALVGNPGPLWALLGPCGSPWALMGRALVGPRARPSWAPWALMGRA